MRLIVGIYLLKYQPNSELHGVFLSCAYCFSHLGGSNGFN